MSKNRPDTRNTIKSGNPIKKVRNPVAEYFINSDTLRSTLHFVLYSIALRYICTRSYVSETTEISTFSIIITRNIYAIHFIPHPTSVWKS